MRCALPALPAMLYRVRYKVTYIILNATKIENLNFVFRRCENLHEILSESKYMQNECFVMSRPKAALNELFFFEFWWIHKISYIQLKVSWQSLPCSMFIHCLTTWHFHFPPNGFISNFEQTVQRQSHTEWINWFWLFDFTYQTILWHRIVINRSA